MRPPGRYFCSPWVESNTRHICKSPAAALDLGCGRGRHTLLLLELGYNVTAIDRDNAALAELERRVPVAARDRLRTLCHDLETSPGSVTWPEAIAGQRFGAVLVVNYLYRPMLSQLVALLEDDGVLIFEAWAQGNEAYACPKDAQVLADRSLRPNELLEMALPDCEVLGFTHGVLEEYEGRDCVKQMICARRRRSVESPKSPACVDTTVGKDPEPDRKSSCSGRAQELNALLSGCSRGQSFLQEPFGREHLHGVKAAPSLPFRVKELLELLRDYDPEPARKAHMQRMRKFIIEGAVSPSLASEAGGSGEGGCAAPPLRLWNATMVRRLPTGDDKGTLRTDTIDDDAKIRDFLSNAKLSSEEDLADRGENWTFVVNQLQGAAECLRDLQHGLFCLTGLSGGFNGYLTPPGAIGKPPHVDDHDVIVLQQAGEKVWMLLDDVTKQTVREVHLKQGDVMYLPQGVPHHARALPGAPSMHLAVGLHRSPMSAASVLAALLTVRALGHTATGTLSTALVEEMDTRFAVFTAFGGREHWLNQLLPASIHIPLVSALDPGDLRSCRFLEAKDGVPADCLLNLAKELASAARRLLETIRGGPVPVPGDAPGAARYRAMQQAAAMADQADLKAVAATAPTELMPLAAAAFWARREHVMDQHYGRYGPRPVTTEAATLAADLFANNGEDGLWQRGSAQVAALWRPGGILRVNGYRFPDLTTEEDAATRFCLRIFSGAAGKPFRLADMPGDGDAKRAVLGKLVRVGAVTRAS